MKLFLSNFMAIKSAEVDLSGLTFVAARNEAGKSTLAIALGSLLTGEKLPYDEVMVKTAGELVHTEAPTGSTAVICLQTADGTIRHDYPDCIRATKGDAPSASRCAVGFESILDMPVKDRTAWLTKQLDITVTKEDIEEELKNCNWTDAAIFGCVEEVRLRGADAAIESFKEQGTKLKGQWEKVTGVRRFSTKTWEPIYWTHDLEKATEEDLIKAVEDAKKDSEAALKVEAISESERAQLQDLVGQRDALLKNLKKANKDYKLAEEVVTQRRKEFDSLKVTPTISLRQNCPECNCLLMVTRDQLIVKADAAGPTREQLQAELEKVGEKRIELDAAQKERDEAKAKIALAAEAVNRMNDAARRLDNMDSAPPVQIDREAVRSRLELAQKRLDAFKVKHEADSLQAEIKRLVKIIALLDPSGLRLAKLQKEIENLNTRLAFLGQKAGWKECRLHEDMSITYGGFPAWKLSKSAKFRVRVLLQAVFAERENAPLLVIDAADILETEARNGLIYLLKELGRPALVTATQTPGKDKIPDFKAAGFGITYLIIDGKTQELGVTNGKREGRNVLREPAGMASDANR